jgi:hypothetical protein
MARPETKITPPPPPKRQPVDEPEPDEESDVAQLRSKLESARDAIDDALEQLEQ